MHGSKRNISKNTIELEIYKTFEEFKKQSKLTVAEYLQKFDVSYFKAREYCTIKFHYESIIKLLLYKQIKGFKFNTKLTKYLRRNPKDKYRIGFSQTPDRTQIGHVYNKILDDSPKELLKYTASKIIEISEKFGILLDVNILKPEKPRKQTEKRNQYIQKDKQTREACNLLKKRISPFINLNQYHNVQYSKKQLIDLLIHLGLNQDFAENGSKVFKELRKQQGPDADTLLYHLKKYDDLKELQRMFIQVFEVVWNIANTYNLFNPRKKLDVAIDYTEWFYYGKKGFMVTGKKPERGTSKCYKFATINIVESGKRFTLLAIPISTLENKEKILSTLLLYALKRIRIRYAFLDRGFFDSQSIQTLSHLHLKYLMPAIRNVNIRKLMKIAPAPSVVKIIN